MIVKQRGGENKVSKMELVGNVKGKECVILDDMIDTAVFIIYYNYYINLLIFYQVTVCKAAEELKRNGAKNVICYATHVNFNLYYPLIYNNFSFIQWKCY